ncbi:hypothetical protein CCP1ISM_170008 [Azospirillaceae bacterium]
MTRKWRLSGLLLPLVIVSFVGLVLAAGMFAAQGARSVVLAVRFENGSRIETEVNYSDYHEYLDRTKNRLSSRLDQSKERIDKAVANELAQIIQEMDKGVEEYADWYFTWGTTHNIVYTALTAYAGAIGSLTISPRQAAAEALHKVFEDKFIELVVKPDVNQARMEAALKRIEAAERSDFADAVAYEIDEMRRFVRASATSQGRLAANGSLWSSADVVDWTELTQKAEALSDEVKQEGRPSGLPPTDAVDFSNLARNALIQSTVNNIAGFTTSLATPTLTIIDTGTAVSTTLVSVLGPLAPFFTPEMLVLGTGIAMITDYVMVKAAEYGGRDELRESARNGLHLVHTKLKVLFHEKLDRNAEHLYAELSGLMSQKN